MNPLISTLKLPTDNLILRKDNICVLLYLAYIPQKEESRSVNERLFFSKKYYPQLKKNSAKDSAFRIRKLFLKSLAKTLQASHGFKLKQSTKIIVTCFSFNLKL